MCEGNGITQFMPVEKHIELISWNLNSEPFELLLSYVSFFCQLKNEIGWDL